MSNQNRNYYWTKGEGFNRKGREGKQGKVGMEDNEWEAMEGKGRNGKEWG